MILRREFESYEAYVHAQGGKARGRRQELLAALPAQVLRFSALFVQARPLLKDGPVLCLGARTGAEMLAFEALGLKGSVGIDLHPIGKGVRAGDWHRLPPEFADGSFANVFTNSFDHCLYLEQACAEVRRVLQPGGRFYLMASDKGVKDSARAEAWQRSAHNETLFWSQAEELRDAVRREGFRQVVAPWKTGCWSHFILEPRCSR